MSYTRWKVVTPTGVVYGYPKYTLALKSAREISAICNRGIEIQRYPTPYKAKLIICNFKSKEKTN